MKQIFWILLILSSCNSPENHKDLVFDKVIHEVETNYAGFTDKTENNLEYYNYLKAKLYKDIYEAPDSEKEIIKKYLSFFKDKHLNISGRRTDYSPIKYEFEFIDKNTSYLKIPSFSNKSKVEDLIHQHSDEILSKSNLIIDIRGNSGGSDGAFRKLLPIIATNDIYSRNIYFFATKDNCRNIEKSLGKNIWTKEIDGHFIPAPWLNNQNDYLFKTHEVNYEVNEYPKQIALIIDRNVASSGEQFVYYAMQSRKVKVYGENTSGCLDYSNCRIVDLYVDDMKLSIPTTKTRGLPINSIDYHGIAPDYFLNSEDQISQVMKYLNSWE
ncbi:MAG: S41 family peptidase [Prolixibacteraceae bacterium]